MVSRRAVRRVHQDLVAAALDRDHQLRLAACSPAQCAAAAVTIACMADRACGSPAPGTPRHAALVQEVREALAAVGLDGAPIRVNTGPGGYRAAPPHPRERS